MKISKFKSESLEDTCGIARKFLANIPKKRERAFLVLLAGDLGVGKTAFVKQVARALDIREKVISPTFVLMRKYSIPPPQLFNHLIHIDAYRLEDKKELDVLDFHQISRDPQNIIFLEWPERVFTRSPRDARKITFKFVDEKTREVKF